MGKIKKNKCNIRKLLLLRFNFSLIWLQRRNKIIRVLMYVSLFLTNAPLLYQLKTERKPLARKHWPDIDWEKFQSVLLTNNNFISIHFKVLWKVGLSNCHVFCHRKFEIFTKALEFCSVIAYFKFNHLGFLRC